MKIFTKTNFEEGYDVNLLQKRGFTFLLMFCMLFIGQTIFAQSVNGTLLDSESGDPIIGATIREVGTQDNGTISDIDGKFILTLQGNSGAVVASYIGYDSSEIAVSGLDQVTIQLKPVGLAMDEVVVTALGITREKASLTYSVQEVGGSTLSQTRETNVANALSGQVSGLQVVKGSNGPASSSKIILRGMNSLTNDNQPLIVVDGIPMDNFTGASNNDFWNPSQDMGNGLGDLNPDNIASISVLKGGAAAALYGSRAGNGVILVTTKKGTASKGLGINFSTNVGLQSNFLTPNYQNSFAQGTEGIYNNISGSSWGPEITGQQVESWNGETVTLQDYDNLDNYLDTGINWSNNLSFQNSVTDATAIYSSISYMDDKSMLPGSALERINLLSRATSTFGSSKNWTSDVKVQYILNKANNRPFNGHPTSLRNTASQVYTLPRNIDITDFSSGSDEFGNMIWYVPSNSLNPYWGTMNDLNRDERDRFMLNGTVSNKINSWLSAELQAGADIYATDLNARTFSGGPSSTNGRYSVSTNSFNETNYSGRLTAQKDNLIGKLGTTFFIGGNLMHTTFESSSINAGSLEVPNFFTVNNTEGNPTVSKGYSEQKINSMYGQLQLNYDGFFFVDFSGRNDWSSTLSEDNRSFFYPSVSTSFLFSDLMSSNGNLPNWMELGKVRFSYSEVGNSLNPYELENFFRITNTPNGVTGASRNNILFNPDVQNELIKSIEAGIEGRFFDNRLGFDLTYYKSNATNQLLNLPLNPLSGYSSFKANAGDLQNEGLELFLDAQLLNKGDFSWNTSLNWAKNKNTIVELTDDVSQITLISLDNLSIVAAEGEEYGQIYGSKYMRVEDASSPHFGKKVVDAQGLPLPASGKHLLGSQQPDTMLGWTNSFTFKKLDVGILIDGRFGGEIFSGSNRTYKQLGMLDETVVNGKREDFVVDGVVADGNGGYVANSESVSPQLYWEAVTARSGNLGITEESIYSATNIRIRNAYVNYSFPKEFASKLKMQKFKLGVSMNNVAMLKNSLNGVDPESVYATSSNGIGFESLSSPTPRTIFFNLQAGF